MIYALDHYQASRARLPMTKRSNDRKTNATRWSAPVAGTVREKAEGHLVPQKPFPCQTV